MIKSIGHIAINAKGIDESLDFYKRVLGLPEAFRLHNDDGSLWLVWLKTGPDDFLEIFAGGAKPPERRSDQEAVRHFSFWVDDLMATLASLQNNGIAIDKNSVKVGRSGCKQYFITDPDGVRIELMELLPDSLQAKTIREL